MVNVLKRDSACIFRKPPEDVNCKFLRNTATQIICYPNLDHIIVGAVCFAPILQGSGPVTSWFGG
jgi:hypothetical protein